MIFFRRSFAFADVSLSRDMSWVTVMCGQSIDMHIATLAFCGGPPGSLAWERAKQWKQRVKLPHLVNSNAAHGVGVASPNRFRMRLFWWTWHFTVAIKRKNCTPYTLCFPVFKQMKYSCLRNRWKTSRRRDGDWISWLRILLASTAPKVLAVGTEVWLILYVSPGTLGNRHETTSVWQVAHATGVKDENV